VSATRALELPAVGDRVGTVCGPGDDPERRAGTITSLESSRFGRWAVVAMDDGTLETCHDLTTVGIGWYRLPRCTEGA